MKSIRSSICKKKKKLGLLTIHRKYSSLWKSVKINFLNSNTNKTWLIYFVIGMENWYVFSWEILTKLLKYFFYQNTISLHHMQHFSPNLNTKRMIKKLEEEHSGVHNSILILYLLYRRYEGSTGEGQLYFS
jgi:hypothetical protein